MQLQIQSYFGSFKEGISASRRHGESLNLIPSPAASRREGIRRGLGFMLSFINLTTCVNSGHVGLNQSDTPHTRRSLLGHMEAHPGPGAFRDLLLPQESPCGFVCSSRVSSPAPPACSPARRLTRSSQQSQAEVCFYFFIFFGWVPIRRGGAFDIREMCPAALCIAGKMLPRRKCDFEHQMEPLLSVNVSQAFFSVTL